MASSDVWVEIRFLGRINIKQQKILFLKLYTYFTRNICLIFTNSIPTNWVRSVSQWLKNFPFSPSLFKWILFADKKFINDFELNHNFKRPRKAELIVTEKEKNKINNFSWNELFCWHWIKYNTIFQRRRRKKNVFLRNCKVRFMEIYAHPPKNKEKKYIVRVFFFFFF